MEMRCEDTKFKVGNKKMCGRLGEALVVEFWWGEVIRVTISI